MSARVQKHVETDFGITFRVEGTGGGCTALVGTLEGVTLVLVDGNLGHDLDSAEYVQVAFYGMGEWEEGEDSLANVEVPCAYYADAEGNEVPFIAGNSVSSAIVALARSI